MVSTVSNSIPRNFAVSCAHAARAAASWISRSANTLLGVVGLGSKVKRESQRAIHRAPVKTQAPAGPRRTNHNIRLKPTSAGKRTRTARGQSFRSNPNKGKVKTKTTTVYDGGLGRPSSYKRKETQTYRITPNKKSLPLNNK